MNESTRSRGAGRRRPIPLALVAAELVAALAFACGPEGPPPEEDPLAVSQAYHLSLREGELANARRSAWLPEDEAESAAALERMRATGELLRDGRLRLEAVESRSEDDWALVVLRVRQRALGGEVFALRPEWLLRVDGRWRVIAPALIGDAGLAAHRSEGQVGLADWFAAEQEALEARWLRQLP